MTGITLAITIKNGDSSAAGGEELGTYSQALLVPLSVHMFFLGKLWTFYLTYVFQGIGPTLIALRVASKTRETSMDVTCNLSRLTFRRSGRRNETLTGGTNRNWHSDVGFHRSQMGEPPINFDIASRHDGGDKQNQEKKIKQESVERIV